MNEENIKNQNPEVTNPEEKDGEHTIREEICSRISVDDKGNLYPIRTKEAEEAALKDRNILDKKFEGESSNDYTTIDPSDLISAGSPEDATEEEDRAIASITHTDAIEIGGKIFNLVAAKTCTEVINHLPNGVWQQITFQVDFSRSEAGSLEANGFQFVTVPADLPRRRVSSNLKDGLIVVTKNINGFKISVLLEDIGDSSYEKLCRINRWILDYQGAITEKTLKKLKEMGLAEEELIKSQAAVGLVPKARRAYCRRKAEEIRGESNENITITPQIKKESREVAKAVNDTLNLIPLTESTVAFGLIVQTIRVTDDQTVIKKWTSARESLSYFSKGNSKGRIERGTGSYRRVPICQDMQMEIASKMVELCFYILPLFENIAREQLGIQSRVKEGNFPAPIKPELSSYQELLEVDPRVIYEIQQSLVKEAQAIIDKQFTEAKEKRKSSALSTFLENQKKMIAQKEEELKAFREREEN